MKIRSGRDKREHGTQKKRTMKNQKIKYEEEIEYNGVNKIWFEGTIVFDLQ